MLSPEQVKNLLGQIALFEGCSDETLAEIAKFAREFEVQKGQILYKPGDEAQNVYILVNGIVTFLNQSGLEFLNVQKVMERSMMFGWIALVPKQSKRIGTAQCLEDSTILSLDGEKVLEILKKDTDSGFLVMSRLCTLIAGTFVERT